MYYRRKLILSILEEFGGKVNHTKFQKILFLVTRSQEKKSFDFVPYKYGCFSFQSNQDLQTLGKYGLVENASSGKTSNWVLKAKEGNYFTELKKSDQSAVRKVKRDTESFSSRDLIRHTYLNFPYYAVKSHIAKDLLSEEELEAVVRQKRELSSKSFFTIGYEGISLENYLNKLIINDVKLLCDVRKNSLSMKYGFSKSQLKNACESIGIKFIHLPNLGIESNKRKELNSIADYNELFEEYELSTLKNNESLEYLFKLAYQYERVAITCFEREVCMCHRGRVLKALTSRSDWDIPHKNL